MRKPLPTYDLRVPMPVPRCPACDCDRLSVTRSIDNGDDTRTQWLRCSRCDHAIKLVVECRSVSLFPDQEIESGDGDSVPA